MPVSTKNVITVISSFKKPFAKNEIISRILSSSSENKNKIKGKRRRKDSASRAQQKDIEKINSVINALASAGYLVRKKKNFAPGHALAAEGIIRINSSGNGIVQSRHAGEIIIKKNEVQLAHNNDKVSVELIDFFRGAFYGRVKSVLSTKHLRFFARLSRISGSQVYFAPLDVSGSDELCADRRGIKDIDRSLDGQHLFLIKPENDMTGHVQNCTVEKIFHIDDEEYDILRVMIKNSLPGEYPDFQELIDLESGIQEHHLADRTDFRSLFSVTIDGDNAKDYDDAVSIEKSGKNYRLYVHIADVSAYVEKGSRLDHEAFSRGTSYYLGNKVIPMLHEKLSNDLCSLKEKVDRLTMTVEMLFDKTGGLLEKKFHISIIKVNKRLTYKTADSYIDRDDSSRFTRSMKLMHDLSRILKSMRLKKGRLDLNLADVELVYENNLFRSIEYSDRLRSHSIIEEFMLSANEVVAEELTKKGVPSLYRVHERISDDSIDSLTNFVRMLNLKLKKSGNIGISIQNMLENAKGNDNEHVINLIVLKSLMQAYYGVEPLGHFGLGFENYTHFTSPIRRYPDLVVHRCLKSIISNHKIPYTMNELIHIGEKSSELERVAQSAERDLLKIKSCRFMKNRIGETFGGIVSGIVKSGFFVSLIEYPIEGMVPLFLLDDDYYDNYDDYTVIGRKTNRTFRLGQKIQVKLKEVKIDRMMIDFSVVR